MTRSKPDEISDRLVEASGQHAGADMPCRWSFGFTAAENRTLDLARLIFDMHRSGQAETWMMAMQLAESAEGPFEGPYLVARITALARAALAERNRPYAYMSAGCMYVSTDEADLMRVVRFARMGPFSDLKLAARALAGHDHVCRIVASATSLVQPSAMRWAGARETHDCENERASEAESRVRLH